MSITLQAGKRYVNRSGWITPPIQKITDDKYEMYKFGIAPNFVVLHAWTDEGKAPFDKREDDLVAEVEVKP